jgi:hypothetical protein
MSGSLLPIMCSEANGSLQDSRSAGATSLLPLLADPPAAAAAAAAAAA